MAKVPLLAGTRVAVVDVADGDAVLRPPAPGHAIADVTAAVREALRFPLAGPPVEQLVTKGGTATIVIEPPHLPIPSSPSDPRQDAIAAVADELERLGVSQLTVLVATGLHQRLSPREIGLLFRPGFRRRFRGRVIVHDAEAEDLADLGSSGPLPLRVARALVETDLVVIVTAAETVNAGGPAALLRSASSEVNRAGGATSLLETAGSNGWELAVEIERLLSKRVPVFGISLALNLPAVFGGYPYEEDMLERVARSKLRRALAALPGSIRGRMIDRLPRELTAAAVFGGTPSNAHSEALVRAIEFKGARVGEPLDAIVIGVPPTTAFIPRGRPNPLAAAYLGLGLALRSWRNGFPVKQGGTAILLHDFQRRFPAPSQSPYRALFADPRTARDPRALRMAERAALRDERAIADYRAGRSVHPLEPFSVWSACDASISRLGTVLVAGCRDGPAARQLGFVPVHGVGAALGMARAGGAERIGYLLSPPYFPLLVG
ncbi:MAG TPA: lactate racemase domain-containing protein [Gaiellaceae bacterium]